MIDPNKLLFILSLICVIPQGHAVTAEQQMTLKDAIVFAEKINPDIERALEQRRSAEWGLRSSYLNLLPELSTSYTPSNTRMQITDNLDLKIKDRGWNREIELPVFGHKFSSLWDIKTAQNNKEIGIFNDIQNRITLSAKIAESYVELLTIAEMLSFYTQLKDNIYPALLAQAQSEKVRGLVAASMQNLEGVYLDIQTGWFSSVSLFEIDTGHLPDNLASINSEDAIFQIPDGVDSALQIAQSHSPAILAAKKAVDNAKLESKQAWLAPFTPTIGFYISENLPRSTYTFAGDTSGIPEDFNTGRFGQGDSTSVGGQITFSFNFGAFSDAKAKSHLADAASATYRNILFNAKKSLTQTYTRYANLELNRVSLQEGYDRIDNEIKSYISNINNLTDSEIDTLVQTIQAWRGLFHSLNGTRQSILNLKITIASSIGTFRDNALNSNPKVSPTAVGLKNKTSSHKREFILAIPQNFEKSNFVVPQISDL